MAADGADRRCRRGVFTWVVRVTIKCSRPFRLYLRDAIDELIAGCRTCCRCPRSARRTRERHGRCPATPTCNRRCRARSLGGPAGFAAEVRDDAESLRAVHRPCGEESARLRCRIWHTRPTDRPRSDAGETGLRRHAGAGNGCAAVTREGPSRSCCSRSRCSCRISGALRPTPLLFYTQEFGFLELPEAFTTGSSIMPQKRNPDVFELIRGAFGERAGPVSRKRSASAPSCRQVINATCSC